MDLSPFRAIDPCGYPGLDVTQMRELGCAITPDIAEEKLAQRLLARLQTPWPLT